MLVTFDVSNDAQLIVCKLGATLEQALLRSSPERYRESVKSIDVTFPSL